MLAEGHRKAAEGIEKGLAQVKVWLDSETSALVKDKVEMLVTRHSDILAIILYGSVARHEERSTDDSYPSDVDLLAIFAGDKASIRNQRPELFESMGFAENRHLKAPREVNVMFTSRTSQEWDPTFIANVKRDGIILFQRGELPEVFAA